MCVVARWVLPGSEVVLPGAHRGACGPEGLWVFGGAGSEVVVVARVASEGGGGVRGIGGVSQGRCRTRRS